MVKVYNDLKDHYLRVLELVQTNPAEIKIVAYTMGRLSYDYELEGEGRSAPNMLGNILELIDLKVKSRMIKKATVLIGRPPAESGTLENYPNISWRRHDNFHTKCWLFQYQKSRRLEPVALIGSRNLAVSIWPELTVEVRGDSCLPATNQIDTLLSQSQEFTVEQDWYTQSTDPEFTDQDPTRE